VRKHSHSPSLIFLISFAEGGLLMAAELIASRIMAPLFGSSVYVWGIVLALTLLTLSLGYFLGSSLFAKTANKLRFVLGNMALIGLALLIMPFLGIIQISFCASLPFHAALIASAAMLLIPPVLLCGMLSPTLVGMLHDEYQKHAAISAGRIYAVSTLGGVCLTLLTAYLFLPELGIKATCGIVGGFSMLMALFMMLRYRTLKPLLLVLALVCSSFFMFNLFGAEHHEKNDGFTTHRVTEGVMGQILVVDFPTVSMGIMAKERHLFVNGIIQTSYIPGHANLNNHDYFKGIELIFSQLKPNDPTLILGLGGGVLANYAAAGGLNVDAVELDQRIVDCARNYFGLSNSVAVFTDDARNYLRTCTKKYACILIDLFRGEEPPAYFFTSEAFAQMKNMLQPGGILLMNSNGYYSGSVGAGNRAILRTMEACGLHAKVFNSNAVESQSSMIILAQDARSKSAVPLQLAAPFAQVYPKLSEHDELLTDNRAVFDVLNQKAALEWRKGYLQYLLPLYEQNKIPLIL
jgi:predicted membrane-bound spermidine synthase